MPTQQSNRYLLLPSCIALLLSALISCTNLPPQQDADVIVVGAGIAGLSAALEASAAGARVLVIEANSVGGGHAVKAGGFALVDTALQRAKGIQDSPDIAYRDLFYWGEDPDPYWTRQYVEQSASEVYDWLTGMGVEFKLILDTPESSVPRFHFTRGTAVNAVVPMLRKAVLDPNIEFVWNTRVTALAKARGRIVGVFTVNERDGRKQQLRAASTVLATGGFQNNLNMVRDNWPADQSVPQRLFKGAGKFATGDGYRLAAWAGAEMHNMDRQVTFYSGVPDPHDPSGSKALYTENPAAIWLAGNGRRFINEAADDKAVAAAVRELPAMSYWLLFDSRGSSRLNVRDALKQNAKTLRAEILEDPAITVSASNLDELARKARLPAHGVRTSVETWNRMVGLGSDFQFDRFTPGNKPPYIRPISKPPYYALRVYPLTRKSMGGPAINIYGQVTDSGGLPIAGLYAAGELTGVAGINGQHGGAGTFLGPSVLTGRVAGKQAAADSLLPGQPARYRQKAFYAGQKPAVVSNVTGDAATAKTSSGAANVAPDFDQPGYWHYDAVHRLVFEQAYTCDRCHSDQSSMQSMDQPGAMLVRLNSCTRCH